MFELSVIIPIYNTPTEALLRCFDSVATLSDIRYEVLLIDDGSQPSVGSFCQTYAQQHDRFRYFHQENAGVSAARNAGIRHAQGQYIAFLDADDALMGSAVSPALLQENHGLIIYDLLLQEGTRQNIWHAIDAPAGSVTRDQMLKQLITSKSLNSPCGKLFCRSVIQENQLQFDTGFVTGEDWNFVCDYVLQIPQACYVGKPSYCYDRAGGTSVTRIQRFPDKMLANAQQMLERKQVLVQKTDLSSQGQSLIGVAAAMYLEELFNNATDLLLLRKMTRQRKTLIRESADYATGLLHSQASKKARIKSLLLRRFWFVMGPLTCLRKLYLKLKH